MSVIGYDGKIRPKSVAVNYKPQGTMSPEQMERIHNARPDYVSGVMKMFDSINTNMTDTIGYFDKARKEREAVEHAEEKFRSGQKLSEILDNPDATPEEMQEAVDKHNAGVAARHPVGKGSATDRARSLELAAQGESATRQVRAKANRQKKEAEALGREEEKLTVKQKAYEVSLNPDMPLEAKLDELDRIMAGFSSATGGEVDAKRQLLALKGIVQDRVNFLKEKEVRDKEIIHNAELDVKGRDLVSNLNKGLNQYIQIKINENPDMVLDDTGPLIDEYFNQVAGNARDGLEGTDLARFDAVASSWKGSATFQFGEALSKYKYAKTQENINKASASAAAGADGIISAFVRSYSAVDEYTQAGMVDKAGQVKIGVSTAVAWMGNAAQKTLEGYDRTKAEVAESYQSWEREYGAEKADEMVAERYEKARQEVKDAIDTVKKESEMLFDFLSGDGSGLKLSKLDKDFYKASIDDATNKIVLSLENGIEQKRVSAAATAKKVKEEVGVNRFVSIQKFLRGESAEIAQDAVPLYRKLERKDAYLAEWDASLAEQGFTPEVRTAMLEEFITNRYPNLEKGDQINAAVDDFIIAIAGLDMSNKGEQNALDIESLLDSAARLFGPTSDSFKKIALFAYNNMRKEKNGMGNEAIAVVNDALLDGFTPSSEEGREKLDASSALRSWYYKTVSLLQELPYEGDEWRQKAEEIKVNIGKRKAFMSIATASAFEEGVKVAKNRVDDRAKAGSQPRAAQTEGGAPWMKDVDEFMAKLDDEAKIAGEKAELETLNRGGSMKNAKDAYDDAYNEYWFNKYRNSMSWIVRKSQGWLNDLVERNSASTTKRYIRNALERTAKERYEKDENKRRYDNELALAISEIDKLGLRDAYNKALVPRAYVRPGSLMPQTAGLENPDPLKAAKLVLARNKEEETKKKRASELEAVVAKRETRDFFASVAKEELATKNYGLREDGTKKGDGWFGEIKLPDGSVMTEVSITIEKNGVSVDIPTITPMTTKQELDFIARTASMRISEMSGEDKKMFEETAKKAEEWAERRWKQGKSPYITKGEEFVPLPKDEEGGEKK